MRATWHALQADLVQSTNRRIFQTDFAEFRERYGELRPFRDAAASARPAARARRGLPRAQRDPGGARVGRAGARRRRRDGGHPCAAGALAGARRGPPPALAPLPRRARGTGVADLHARRPRHPRPRPRARGLDRRDADPQHRARHPPRSAATWAEAKRRVPPDDGWRRGSPGDRCSASADRSRRRGGDAADRRAAADIGSATTPSWWSRWRSWATASTRRRSSSASPTRPRASATSAPSGGCG